MSQSIVARAIKAAGSINELARRVGVSRQVVQHWKRTRKVPVQHWWGVSNATGIAMRQLMPNRQARKRNGAKR